MGMPHKAEKADFAQYRLKYIFGHERKEKDHGQIILEQMAQEELPSQTDL